MSDVWAAPGSVPDDLPRAPAPVPQPPRWGAPSPTKVGAVDAAAVLPVPFRPLSLLEVLDGGVEVVRRAPIPVLGVTAVFVVPYALLTAWLSRDLLGESFESVTNPVLATDPETGSSDVATLVQLTLGALAHVLAAGGVARIVLCWFGGTTTSFGDACRWVARRSWVLVVLWFCVRVLEGIGLVVFCVGALVAMTFCLVAVPAAAGEDLGPISALGRSFALTGRRWWPSLWFGLLSGLVATLIGVALGSLPQVVAFAVPDADVLWILVGLVSVVVSTFTTAMVAAATALWYLDLRVRTEGLDLELELAGVRP